MEHLFRFLTGGIVVSIFAVLGDIFRPRNFAGLFGAAPTIAMGTLGLVFWKEGPEVISIEGRSMVIGAAALIAYSLLTSYLLLKRNWSSLPAVLAASTVWFAVSFGLWALLRGVGLL